MLESLKTNPNAIKLVRTVAQAIGGLLVSLLVRWGVDIDDDTVLAVLFPISVAFWVLLVDLLVKYVNPLFERLNIITKTPNYTEV